MRFATTTRRSRISTLRVSRGEYVTGDVTPEYLKRLQGERSDEAKQQRRDGAGHGLKSVR